MSEMGFLVLVIFTLMMIIFGLFVILFFIISISPNKERPYGWYLTEKQLKETKVPHLLFALVESSGTEQKVINAVMEAEGKKTGVRFYYKCKSCGIADHSGHQCPKCGADKKVIKDKVNEKKES